MAFQGLPARWQVSRQELLTHRLQAIQAVQPSEAVPGPKQALRACCRSRSQQGHFCWDVTCLCAAAGARKKRRVQEIGHVFRVEPVMKDRLCKILLRVEWLKRARHIAPVLMARVD